MTPIDEPASFGPQGAAASDGRKAKASPSAPEQPGRVAFVAVTLETATGRLAKVEAADAGGTRKELSDGEWADLAETAPWATLESLVEQVFDAGFEAGIACAFGGDARDDGADEGPPESDEDAELRRALLRSLVDRGGVKQLMQHDVLSRAIVGTLIARASGSLAARPDSSH